MLARFSTRPEYSKPRIHRAFCLIVQTVAKPGAYLVLCGYLSLNKHLNRNTFNLSANYLYEWTLNPQLDMYLILCLLLLAPFKSIVLFEGILFSRWSQAINGMINASIESSKC